jgi:CRISPR-associated protein Cas2
MRKFYLISFDISDDKNRRKVVKLLEDNAIRVQKSVFEAWLSDKQYIGLKSKCDQIINHLTDSIRYYNLCQNCVNSIKISGKGIYTDSEELIVI